ncbi:hypothetical protein J4475_00880 [Candidatus Woesearchaeota archaeon]|nr:hypothetical protein [Candidatus Woesearchaeota archaeon]
MGKAIILEQAKKLMILFLLILGILLAYQVALKMAGGSWQTEDLILGLLLFNVSATFTIGILVAQMKAELRHFTNQFSNLIGDMKLKRLI